MSIRDLRAALARLDTVLAEAGEVVVTRRGRAIARILPAEATRVMPSHAEFRNRMPRLATGSEALVRADRDAR
jgi:antitoxin (DNA-binding transcriptional repressor) of toxin-antitoxin stability system